MSIRRILVLYGSQTGYAQETAERVARESIRRHLVPSMNAMDEYDKVNIQKGIEAQMF